MSWHFGGTNLAPACHVQMFDLVLHCAWAVLGEGCPGVLDSQESRRPFNFWRTCGGSAGPGCWPLTLPAFSQSRL